jgi:lipid-binding SYLF domain-containing protein
MTLCIAQGADELGLFAGLTLDGTVLVERKDANKEFYGSAISSTDILT